MSKLRSNLDRAMKKTTDSKRMDFQFLISDLVLVKLCRYKQQAVAMQHSNKLEHKYFRPFTMIERIGLVANKLNLLETSRIHFSNIRLLKKKKNSLNQIEPVFPNSFLVSVDEHVSEGMDIDMDVPGSSKTGAKRARQTPSKLVNYDVTFK